MWGYGARDVSRMLGLSASRVRAWAREGLVSPRRGPRGELRFSFHDLVLLRTARDLLRARVPAPRVKRALRRLRAQLPEGRSLAGVRVTAEGDDVLVRDGAAAWRPDSGQVVLDFEVRDVAAQIAPLILQASQAAGAARGAGDAADAEGFYEWACDLEDGAPEQAREAYRRALTLDPAHYGANLNLGRLLHERADLPAAERHYRRALAARPDEPGALYNLGVALEDQGRGEEALAAYEACLARDPGHADGHHNAARLCERLGRRQQALRHLHAARRIQGSSP